MKNSINNLEFKAKKIAFRFIYSTDYLYLNKSFPQKRHLDMRFNVNKLAANYIRKMKLSQSEIIRIRDLKKQRAISRHFTKPQNTLSNPIVKDYLANKSSLRYIYDDHLSFTGYRNHWAKNETDLKVLTILKKHFCNK